MSSSRPKILITNDDGITAPGLKALVNALKDMGDITIVAPDSPQSGMGHAVTIAKPLRLNKVNYDGLRAYQCSGTPVDCVKLARDIVLKEKPDLCLSGINHGSNSSINVLYSGTMSAAVEAAIEGIPSVGFSLCNHAYNADFSAAAHYARKIAIARLNYDLPESTLLSVNIPNDPLSKIRGVKVCRQANAKWEEEFDERIDPRGRKYYWLTGKFVNYDKREDSDEWALKHHYVSVVPVQFDMTAHHAIAHLNQHWNFD